MTNFSPKKGFKLILPTFGFVSVFTIPLLLILSLSEGTFMPMVHIMVFTYLFIALMSLLAQYTTNYWIKDQHLYYKSILLKGHIDIQCIYKIEMNASNWLANKPATSNKGGMLIYYYKYEDIFITPEDNEEMLQHLLIVNPNIEVFYSK